jgi:hypothetical protein
VLNFSEEKKKKTLGRKAGKDHLAQFVVEKDCRAPVYPYQASGGSCWHASHELDK